MSVFFGTSAQKCLMFPFHRPLPQYRERGRETHSTKTCSNKSPCCNKIVVFCRVEDPEGGIYFVRQLRFLFRRLGYVQEQKSVILDGSNLPRFFRTSPYCASGHMLKMHALLSLRLRGIAQSS